MIDRLPLLTIYLSERCNSRCVTCDYWRHGRRDMSIEDARQLLAELAALDTRDVVISGGEPLLNPHWAEIAELLRGEGLNLWLLTSGLSLAKHASEVAALFASVTVSLDGTTRKSYTAIRGVDAFDKVCEGVRRISAAGAPTSLRVTLQRSNYRELSGFVTLARDLGVCQISFLAVDVSNMHAFARNEIAEPRLALTTEEITEFDSLLDELERNHEFDFKSGFIAESPAKLRRIRDYFAALRGLNPFPPVRCNAPEFSAVVAADGLVSPCFFISGPESTRRDETLRDALNDHEMTALRASIAAGEKPECRTCVCSMWRDTEELSENSFGLAETADA